MARTLFPLDLGLRRICKGKRHVDRGAIARVLRSILSSLI